LRARNGSQRVVAAVSSTGSRVLRNVDVNLGPKGDGVEDGVDAMGKSKRRVVKRVPKMDVMLCMSTACAQAYASKSAIDDGHRVFRGAKNEATHGGPNMLDDDDCRRDWRWQHTVGACRKTVPLLQRPHERGHQAGLAVCHAVARTWV
jgi:hypothetical protein